jgi:hypothetical protein
MFIEVMRFMAAIKAFHEKIRAEVKPMDCRQTGTSRRRREIISHRRRLSTLSF